MTDPKTKTNPGCHLEVVTPGDQPPCLKPGFGFCRGCFGWQNMIEAALSGDPTWSRALVHCSETDLAVRCLLARKPDSVDS